VTDPEITGSFEEAVQMRYKYVEMRNFGYYVAGSRVSLASILHRRRYTDRCDRLPSVHDALHSTCGSGAKASSKFSGIPPKRA
jgi:hypothetical protein